MTRPGAVAVALEVSIRREDVLHFLGYRGHTPGPRTQALLPGVLDEARALIAARGVHRVLEPDQALALGLTCPGSPALAVGLVTIGDELERRVTRCLADGETTHALLLDAAGSAAAEEAADLLERRIVPSAPRASRRFSPGYGRWPVTAQRALFEVIPHDEVGVRLLPSCLMSPRKSVSFALWLDAGTSGDIPDACRTRRCADCDLETCPYREPGGLRP